MIRYLFLLFIFFQSSAFAQPDDFISIEKTGLKNYSPVYTQYYDGKSLWGYMDGGADLYLEYGFEGLIVQEINYKGNTLKCEIYKMSDALGAFGIFSVNRHNCTFSNQIEEQHCINNYQVQLIRGDYYISIVNQSGDTAARATATEVALLFTKNIKDEKVEFPGHPFFKENIGKLQYIRGNTSLSNVYPQALNYLEYISGYNLWLLPASTKKAPVISLITFGNTEDVGNYAKDVFPGVTFETEAERKLKSGGMLLARKIDSTTILQVEGKAGRELKKILGFGSIK